MDDLIREMLEQHRIAIERMNEIAMLGRGKLMMALTSPDEPDSDWWEIRADCVARDRDRRGAEWKLKDAIALRMN